MKITKINGIDKSQKYTLQKQNRNNKQNSKNNKQHNFQELLDKEIAKIKK